MRAGVVLLVLSCALSVRAEVETDPVLGGARRVRGHEAPGLVAFTFDDGPRVGTTEIVLDALVEYDVPATFFVVGHRLWGKSKQPGRDLVARMVELGFDVGTHTFDHVDLSALDPDEAARQIDRTNKLVRRILGKPIGLFRPPFGRLAGENRAHLARRGLTVVTWSIDSHDWEQPDPDEMRATLLDDIFRENGGVVLLHDTKKLTAKAIRPILDELEATNCARLAAGESIVVPVSIHYFLRDGDQPREIPAEVAERTQRYRDNLPARCERRNATDM